MPENTQRLSIPKPLGNEYFNRENFNEILDVIDLNAATNEEVENLAGAGRTTETVKSVADELATHKQEDATDDVHGLLSGGKIIEESGSNANGNYVKFADGTLICYGAYNTTTNSAGISDATITYPSVFSGYPSLNVTKSEVGSAQTWKGALHLRTVASYNSRGIVLIDAEVSTQYTLEWLAIGRWK